MATAEESRQEQEQSRWNWGYSYYAARFFAIHFLVFGAFWVDVVWAEALAVFAVLYSVRMFAVTAGYHRYFSHRTYKMGRVMQFIMAFLAETSAQKGVLWWASHHRYHHTHSDDPDDVHSPKHHGFYHSHVGWIFDPDWSDTADERIKDLSRYPELVWLDRYHMVPPAVLGVATWLLFGWDGLFLGFFGSTVACWHATFTINSLAHVIGNRRYETDDESKNNWFLALITFGEGWHNNHHHYQASANQGFYWWEYDISYYVLKVLSWFGLVKDLRNPPEHVIEDKPHPAARKKAAEASESDGADDGGSVDTGADGSTARDRLRETVQEIGLSAARAQEEASRRVKEIRLAAATRYDELSDEASRQYTGFRDAANEKVQEFRQSARAAQEEAEKKVDQMVDSLQKPEPSPEAG